MRKLRVGVWLTEDINQTLGGGFSYYSILTDCIANTKFSNADICFLGGHLLKNNTVGLYNYYCVKWRPKKNWITIRLIQFIGIKIFNINFINRHFQKLDIEHRESLYAELRGICDIIYYPIPMCKFEDFPFIYTLWDLGHMNSYAFPEVCLGETFETRKNHHNKVPYKALMVFCESESGKNDAIKYLRLNEKRLRILPLFPSGVVSESIKPVKPKVIETDWPFIHYPAQFWAHKNHYNLILAFLLASEKYPNLKLILTGSDQGNQTYITKTIEENKLEKKVINLGFVTMEELKWLYLNSKGMIMPTLLGPTNIPPLEALALGCRVAVSDFPGHREQFGNSAIYFNPLVREDIKKAIEHLLQEDSDIATADVPSVKSNMALLDSYFAEIEAIRHTWA